MTLLETYEKNGISPEVYAFGEKALADLKDMMTQEIVETDLYGMATVQNVHRDNLTQMIIIDYHTTMC